MLITILLKNEEECFVGSYEKVSQALKEFFSNNSILRIFLPFDMFFVFGGAGFLVVNIIFFRLGLGSGFFGGIISQIAFWGFLFGLILAFANLNFKVLYIGCFMYGGIQLYRFLRSIFFTRFTFTTNPIVPMLIFGCLGYLAFTIASQKTNAINQ